MRVLCAPDKFAGTLSASEAATALRRGWASVRPDDELVAMPLGDGGAGTLEAVQAAVSGAERRSVDGVADPRGRAVTAEWLRLPDGRALVESAQACGLMRLVATDERDPLGATTYGVGQLIADAESAGVTEILVGLGGSATVDGGAGAATALGHRLLRADGNGVKVGGRHLVDLDHVHPGRRVRVPVVALADVDNPLLGDRGAARVYAPQKGADAAACELLEAALTRLADVTERDLPGGPWRALPGAGAAGGLGFGLAAFARARLVSGAAVVAELVGFDRAVADADVVLTGEGSLDEQTAAGKVPRYVAERAREAGAKVMVVAGRVEGNGAAGFDAVRELGPEGIDRAAELVAERAAELAAAVTAGDWA